MKTCIDAISLSEELVEAWLSDNMLKEEEKDQIKKTVKFLNSHDDSKSHGRHFNYKLCKENGLKIKLLEEDQEFQDAVLSLHHSTMLTFDRTECVKIIENQDGQAYVAFR